MYEDVIALLDVVSIEARRRFSSGSLGCKRKGTGCAAFQLYGNAFVKWPHFKFNGPSIEGHECSNVVGGCGCSHAEPRLTLDLYRAHKSGMVMVSMYSPCSNCANIMIDSGCYVGCVYDILTEHDTRGVHLLRLAGMSILTRKDLVDAMAGVREAKERCNAAIERWKLSC